MAVNEPDCPHIYFFILSTGISVDAENTLSQLVANGESGKAFSCTYVGRLYKWRGALA